MVECIYQLKSYALTDTWHLPNTTNLSLVQLRDKDLDLVHLRTS